MLHHYQNLERIPYVPPPYVFVQKTILFLILAFLSHLNFVQKRDYVISHSVRSIYVHKRMW